MTSDPTPREYSENERRLLTLAAQRQMLLDATAEAASATIRELIAAIEARDKRLVRIAALATSATEGSERPYAVLEEIEAIAKGE